MIAVMGAAGNVGGKVARILLEQDQKVRVMRHRRGVDRLTELGAEVVTGDAANPADLDALFAGTRAALVLLPEDLADVNFQAIRTEISRRVTGAISRSELTHVVAISAMLGTPQAGGPMAGLREFETLLLGLDVNLMVLRPTAFMDYLLANLPLIRAQRINGSVLKADLPFPMVATRDVAETAAGCLIRRDFIGHSLRRLLGPEDLTMEEATRQLGLRLGMPDLPYQQFPPDEVAAALRQSGISEEAAGLLVQMQQSMNDGLFARDVVRDPQAQTPTRFADFLAEALPPVDIADITLGARS